VLLQPTKLKDMAKDKKNLLSSERDRLRQLDFSERRKALKQFDKYLDEKKKFEEEKKAFDRKDSIRSFKDSNLGKGLNAPYQALDTLSNKSPTIRQARFVNPGKALTKEQMVLGELFGSGKTFDTGENLPKINGVLISGNGLINNNSQGGTAKIFGFRRMRI